MSRFLLVLPLCLVAWPGVAATPPSDLLQLVNSPQVEHGAVVTEFGVFVTRKTGRWGESGTSTIVRISAGADGATVSEVATFARPSASDSSPFYDPNSRRMCFVSDRPHASREPHREDGDIWCVRRQRGGWGEAQPLPTPVNSPGQEYSPVFDPSGALFFASDRSGGAGQGDLYSAHITDHGDWQVENLGLALNSPAGEWNLGLSPNGQQMIFEASSRRENLSVPGDLYFSSRSSSGWNPAIPLSQLNSRGSDLLPRWLDGQTLVFASSRKGGGDVDLMAVQTADYLPVSPVLAVVARSSGELVLLDPITLAQRSRISVGTGPHELAVSLDGRRAVVPLLGIYPQAHGQPVARRPPFVSSPSEGLTRVDLATGETRAFQLAGCLRPHGAAADAQAARVWITCEAEGVVLELAADGSEITRKFEVGQGVHKVIFHPGLDSLVTTNPDTGQLHVVNLASGQVRGLTAGSGAEGVTLSPDGRLAWVAQSGDGSVCRVALNELRLDWCSKLGGGFPIAVALLPARGEVWVSRLASASISVLSAASGKRLLALSLPAGALNLAVNPSAGLVYATLPRRNEVIAIDAASRRIVATATGVMEGDDLDLVSWPHPDYSPDS